MNMFFIGLIILFNISLKAMDAPVAVSSSSSSALATKIKIVSQDGTYNKELASNVLIQALTLKELTGDLEGWESYTLPEKITGEDFSTLEPYLTALTEKKSISMDGIPFKQLCSLAQTADHLNVPAVYHATFNALVQTCGNLETLQQSDVLQESTPCYQKLSSALQSRIAQEIIAKHSILYPLFVRAYAKSIDSKLQPTCILKGTPNTCCFTPDGHAVACVNGTSIELRNPNTGTVQSTLVGTDTINSLVPAHALPLLAAIADKTIRIWNTEEGICKQIFTGHTDDVDECDFDYEDQKVASVSSKDQTIRLWDVAHGNCEAIIPLTSLGTPPPYFRSMIRFFLQRYLAVSESQQVTIYDITTNSSIGKCAFFGTPDSFAINPKGTILAAGDTSNQEIDLFDCSTRKSISINTHSNEKWMQSRRLNPYAFSADSSKLVTKKDQFAQVYDVASKKLLFELKEGISSASFVPGTDVLVTCNSRSIAFWDSSRRLCITKWQNPHYNPPLKVTRIFFPSHTFDALNQKCLMQTSAEEMSVFPMVDSVQVNNLSIEKLIALLYTAQNIKESKSSIKLPNAAIGRAFHALPDTLKSAIIADIIKNRSWSEWLSSFVNELGE